MQAISHIVAIIIQWENENTKTWFEFIVPATHHSMCYHLPGSLHNNLPPVSPRRNFKDQRAAFDFPGAAYCDEQLAVAFTFLGGAQINGISDTVIGNRPLDVGIGEGARPRVDAGIHPAELFR